MILELLLTVALTVESEESCASVPYTKDDAAEISTLIEEFGDGVSYEDVFERVIEHKCKKQRTFADNRGIPSEVETTTFEGYTADTVPGPDTIERDVLICNVMRIYTDSKLRMLEKRCDWHKEVFMQFPGIEGDIRLIFGLSVDDARMFLTYLSSMSGKSVRGQVIPEEAFRTVFQVHGISRNDIQTVEARYLSSCGRARTISATRQVGTDSEYRITSFARSGC